MSTDVSGLFIITLNTLLPYCCFKLKFDTELQVDIWWQHWKRSQRQPEQCLTHSLITQTHTKSLYTLCNSILKHHSNGAHTCHTDMHDHHHFLCTRSWQSYSQSRLHEDELELLLMPETGSVPWPISLAVNFLLPSKNLHYSHAL